MMDKPKNEKKKKPNLGRVPLPNKPPKVETPPTVYKRSRDKKVPEVEQQGEDEGTL
jgi:hypothetical protein